MTKSSNTREVSDLENKIVNILVCYSADLSRACGLYEGLTGGQQDRYLENRLKAISEAIKEYKTDIKKDNHVKEY